MGAIKGAGVEGGKETGANLNLSSCEAREAKATL
jgi:hypothetical protein